VLSARWFVGIDWASDTHVICVIDREGRSWEENRRVAHTAVGLQALVAALLERAAGDPAAIVVGIEAPRGAVVELLVERGIAVSAINPKQGDRFRDRFTVAGAKDDRRDGLVIADALRTDPHACRRVLLDHPLIIQLREWSRMADDLGLEVGRLTHQLRDLVYRLSPGLLTLCPGADEPWLWRLRREAPTPAAQQRLSTHRLARRLRETRVRRFDAAQLWALVHQPVV
jgi:Transposase